MIEVIVQAAIKSRHKVSVSSSVGKPKRGDSFEWNIYIHIYDYIKMYIFCGQPLIYGSSRMWPNGHLTIIYRSMILIRWQGRFYFGHLANSTKRKIMMILLYETDFKWKIKDDSWICWQSLWMIMKYMIY